MEQFETQFGISRIVFGVQSLDRLGQLARDLGATRTLLVTDRGLREAGHVDRALAALREASLEAAIYDGVEPDPTTRHVAEGLEVAQEFLRAPAFPPEEHSGAARQGQKADGDGPGERHQASSTTIPSRQSMLAVDTVARNSTNCSGLSASRTSRDRCWICSTWLA